MKKTEHGRIYVSGKTKAAVMDIDSPQIYTLPIKIDTILDCFSGYLDLNRNIIPMSCMYALCVPCIEERIPGYCSPKSIGEWVVDYPDLRDYHPKEKDFGPPLGGKVFFRIEYQKGVNEDEMKYLDRFMGYQGFFLYNANDPSILR